MRKKECVSVKNADRQKTIFLNNVFICKGAENISISNLYPSLM